MPFVLPTIPFTLMSERFGSAFTVRPPTATVFGTSLARLDASIGAVPLLGRCATLASLGLNAGVAPAGATRLTVTVNTDTFENGQVVGAFAYSAAFAGLRIFIEEFSAAGAFIRGVAGPMTTVYDARAVIFGVDVRSMERRSRSANFLLPVVAGRFYRVWVDSMQSVFVQGITGPATAGSNFTYTFGPAFFAFT